MSATGQGDTIGEISNDDEAEISSTTCDSAGIEQKVSDPAKIVVVPTDTARDIVDPTISSIDSIPSEPTVANVDDMGITMDVGKESGDHAVTTIKVVASSSICEQKAEMDSVIENTFETISGSKEFLDKLIDNKAESNQVDVDSSSLYDELELRWDDDDDEEKNIPISDEVLKLLDEEQEINDEEKSIVNVGSGAKSIDKVDPEKDLGNVIQVILSSGEEVAKKQNYNDNDVEMTPLNESLQQSIKILDSSDNLTADSNKQDVEIENAVNSILNDKVLDSTQDVEFMKSINVKTNLEQSSEHSKAMTIIVNSDNTENKGTNDDDMTFGNDSIENIIADIDNLTTGNRDVEKEIAVDKKNNENDNAPINSGLEKSASDISLPESHIELNIENSKSTTDEKSERLEVSKATHEIISDSEHKELPMDENYAASIENSLMYSLHSKKAQNMSNNPECLHSEEPFENPKKDSLNLKEVGTTTINLDNKVVHVKNEQGNTNVMEISGSTQDVSYISDPVIVDPNNQTMSSTDIPINISYLEYAEKRDTLTTPNVHHRLNKPNAMLDIPTQELSNIEAELDDDYHDSYDEANGSGQKSQESMKMDISVEEVFAENVIKDNADLNVKIKQVSSNVKEINEIGDIEMVNTDTAIFTVANDSNKTESNKLAEPVIEIATTSKNQVFGESPEDVLNAEISKSKLEVDVEKPFTSKKYENYEIPSLKLTQNTDDAQPSILKPIQDDSPVIKDANEEDVTPSILKIKFEKDVSPAKCTQDDGNSESTAQKVIDNEKLSTIKCENDDLLTKSTKDDVDISTAAVEEENGSDRQSMSKIRYENDKSPAKSTQSTADRQTSTLHSTQITDDQSSVVKSTLDNLQPSTSIVKEEIDSETLSISKIKYENNESPTKSTQNTFDVQSLTQITEDQSSTSKSAKENIEPSKSTAKEIDIDRPLITKIKYENDESPAKSPQYTVDEHSSTLQSTQITDEQPSTSKLAGDNVDPSASTAKEIDSDRPLITKIKYENDESPVKSIQNTDVEQISTLQSTQIEHQPSTSKTTHVVQPSTSSAKEVDNEDIQPSKAKEVIDNERQMNDNEKPSTSKSDDTLTSDIAEVQEVTDSLGLLAESSRVMDDDEEGDDDDEPEEPEPDNDDEDEDFDPYDETSSQMVAEQDDSVSPPPELDPKESQTMEPASRQESDEGTLDIVDDIECVENELPGIELAGEDSNEPIADEIADKEAEPEIIDADAHTEKPVTTSSCPPERIMTILERVLGHHNVPDSKVKEAPLAVKVLNYVDIGDVSSDSDDVLEVSKSDLSEEVSVNIPKDVDVMATSGAGGTSEIISNKDEVVISGIPKPAAPKLPTINTSEVTVSTSKSSTSLHIPETTVPPTKGKDEIFSLDSDEEEPPKDPPAPSDGSTRANQPRAPRVGRGCVNPLCTLAATSDEYYAVDRATAAYYSLRRRGVVCLQCHARAHDRRQALIEGIKDLRPLLDLEMDAPSQQLVEISDSESDEESADDTEMIGDKEAEFLEEHLADLLNETWDKYNLGSRLKTTETNIMTELEKIEASAKELDAMLNDCQKKTDANRLEFYGTFQPRRKTLGAIIINDTPFSSYSHIEKDMDEATVQPSSRYPKRRASTAVEPPAKKQAIPLGYTPIEAEKQETQPEIPSDPSKGDDDKDISVVNLSAESAPSDLPPCGEIVHAPLKQGMVTYAMRNAFGAWLKGRLVEVLPKSNGQQFTQCKVKFEHKVKNPCKVLAARCLAYIEPSAVRMPIGTRVIALFKDPHNAARRDSFYSGVVAEIPNPVNNYRYLVFFDDGYAQYVHHRDTRLVCESSVRVWEEVHPFIRDFICKYLRSYPERPMVRLHTGERLKTEWNGRWWDSKVLQVDASIALIHFDEDNRTEWIYRGSTRLAPLYLELQAAEKAGERHRTRLPRSKAQMRSNMPCVEYTRSDEQAPAKLNQDTQAQNEELRRQRAVAKKSTTQAPSAIPGTPFEGVISRVVYYTPKNAIKPYKLTPHVCSPKCKRTDVLSLKELRTYNPLAKPLLSGWERQTVRYKGHREVMYRAPCGRRLRDMPELHRYLRAVNSDFSVDLFDFTPGTHCLAEFVLNKCLVGKKDLSHGKENVPVPCVNYYDESLPEFCSYNTERTPTAGVPLNIDPEFLCGCDCTDDCEDKSKCACWKMTLEGARTIGLDSPNVGYVYRRLPEPLPSGIYECNSRCKCKQTCLNRVAQHPLQLKLQVFKTINRGWGIRALNDVPKGSFLCVYAGNLLTDATANLDGLNEGDEYLAELDYIEVVEAMKEGYEDDVPDEDKKLDKKALGTQSDTDSADEQTESSEDETEPTGQLKDADFQPAYMPQTNMMFKKSLRKRERKKNKAEEKQKEEAKKRDDCITISDDEEVREPSRFTAQADMLDKSFKSKHSSRVSVRTLYGKDEACYIMDAKVQGNIGRYLNHSCHPNVFVQNVFVDTHDPRFPWVAFFALSHVRAGTELTWNYNYDVGSVPGKVLYCHCGAPNCRGRLL